MKRLINIYDNDNLWYNLKKYETNKMAVRRKYPTNKEDKFVNCQFGIEYWSLWDP